MWKSCFANTSGTRPGVSDGKGRILGLDYGSRTVGVAVCDPMRLSVRALEIIRRKEETHLRATFRRLAELVREYEVSELVLGYPLNMDGSAGERAEKTLAFRDELVRRLEVEVHLMDERLTTVEAEEIMAVSGVRRKDYKDKVDAVAAAIILQDWLRHHGDD